MKILIFILTLFIFGKLDAQIWPGIVSSQVKVTTPGGGTTYTDNFDSYSAGSLIGQGPWVNVVNGSLFPVAGTTNKYLSSTDRTMSEVALRISTAFNANQSAQITLQSIVGTSRVVGVIARASGTTSRNYYVYYVGGGGGWLSVVVNGTEIGIASSSHTYTTSDVIKLVADGTSIKCYLNGILDTYMGNATSPATGTGGNYVDNRVSSGTPGVFTWTADAATECQIDDFVAIEL